MCYKNNILLKLSVIVILQIFIVGCEESTAPNQDPVVNSIVAFPNQVQVSDSFAVFCSAHDQDGDLLYYDWTCTNHGASIKGTSTDDPFELLNTKENMMIFYAVDSLNHQYGHAAIFCDVRDGKGGLKTVWIQVEIFR